MPQTNVIIQSSLQGASGLAKDKWENVWHFLDVAGASAQDVALTGCKKIADFFLKAGAVSGRAVSEFLSITNGPNIMTLKCYDFAAALPRPELGIVTFTTLAAGANSLPEEVALCLSYYAGRNLPSQRGRVYIGPLNTSALAASSHNPARPLAAFSICMQEGGTRMKAVGPPAVAPTLVSNTLTGANSASTAWALYSPKLGTFAAITAGWTDDEWDGQSRRRYEASLRYPY